MHIFSYTYDMVTNYSNYFLMYHMTQHHMFIRICPNMQLSTWSITTSINHANFKHSKLARSQYPYNTAANVFKCVITLGYAFYIT